MAAGTRTVINARRKAAAQNKIVPKGAARKNVTQAKLVGKGKMPTSHLVATKGRSTVHVPNQGSRNPGAPAAAAPTTTPATAVAAAPEATPTVEPFWTPEQAAEWTDRHTAMESGLYDLDTALQHLGADTTYQETQIDKAKEQQQASSIDNMIARGLAHSSVKDGELYDIQATAALKKSYLDAALATATIETGRRKKIITDNWTDWLSRTYNPEGVTNAQSITPAVAPEAAQSPPAAQTAPTPVQPTVVSQTPQPSTVTPSPWPRPYQAPTSSAFGGTMGKQPTSHMVATKGVGTMHIPNQAPRNQAAQAWHAARPKRPPRPRATKPPKVAR